MGFAVGRLDLACSASYTSGVSLAVSQDEQNSVAGMVTSVTFLPLSLHRRRGRALWTGIPVPFVVTSALMLLLRLDRTALQSRSERDLSIPGG